MAGLSYSVNFENVTVSAAVQDIWEGLTGGTTAITLHRIGMSWQRTTQENVRYQLLLRSTAGSGGSSVTARALQGKNTTASGVTWNRTVTTPGTAGNVLDSWDWNIVVPFDQVMGKSDLEIEIPAGTRFAFALLGAPGGAYAAASSIVYSER